MGRRFVVGLDIGQTRHPTAIAIVEAGSEILRGRSQTVFGVRRYGILPLGTSYTAVASHVADTLWALRERAPESHPMLRVDATGVGAPVVDILREQLPPGCHLVPVKINGTDKYDYNPDGSASVGNLFIASRLQSLMQTKRLRVNAAHLKELAEELQDYQLQLGRNANVKLEASDQYGSHGDRVVALALAVLEDGFYPEPQRWDRDDSRATPFKGILDADRVGF